MWRILFSHSVSVGPLLGRKPHNLTSYCVFFFYLVCEPIGTAATPGLLCQPRDDIEDDCGEADGM
jgi:hypothetical protein